MSWKEIYRSRLATPEEAVKLIRPGDKVVVAHGPAAPDPILQAMVDNKDNFSNVQFSHMLTFGDKPYAEEELDPHFHLNVFFVGEKTRGIINKGIGDFTPTHFSEIPYILRNVIKPDVTLIQVSKPDKHGYVSLGLSVDYSLPSARISRTVIAEVNEKCPRTFGDSFLHVSEIDCFVETDRQVFEYIPVEIGEKERKIGEYCSELINDGDCIQLGMGAIPDAVLYGLMDKKDLGIHSEIIGDPTIDLIEAGVINGSKKTLHVGKIVITSIFGTRKLHQYVDNNPLFELYPVDYTNNPCVIAKNDNMISINSSVQVDFMGQFCSEAFGPMQYSGIGGQQDFMRGAKLSKGGKGIITFYSTAKNDTVSRIVPIMEAMDAFKGSIVALMSPVIVFVGVAGGVFTITESAGIMALYCFLVGKFYYKEFTMKEIPKMLVATVSVAASVLMVIAFSSILSWFIVAYNVPANLAAAMPSGINKYIFLILINIVFLILGTFIDMIPNLVLTMPVLFPLAQAYGIDPVHFGIIAIVNLAIGLVTPPVGTCLFVASGIANVNQKETYKYAIPICLIMIIGLILTTYIPSVSLFLVSFLR